MFKERLNLTMKVLLITLIVLGVCSSFLFFMFTIVQQSIFALRLIIVAAVVLTSLAFISVMIYGLLHYIKWQFIEPYSYWKRSKSNGH